MRSTAFRGLFLSVTLVSLLLGGCDPDQGFTRLNFGRTALVTGDFDTVEQLLQEVANTSVVQAEVQFYDGYVDGPHFETEVEHGPGELDLQVEDLLRAGTTSGLDQFKTAFLSCGMRGVSDHVYNGVEEDNHLVDDTTVISNLGDAVNNGLKMYFSDWTYEFIEKTWPERVTWLGDEDELDSAQRGRDGAVTARVADEGLATFMELAVGDELEIIFNQGGWAVPTAVGPDVEVLVEGDVWYDDPVTGTYQTLVNAPLVFSFSEGGGQVVYTAFHNEAQITDDARDVLSYSLTRLSSN